MLIVSCGAVLLAIMFAIIPGDVSGIPYPTNKEEMVQQVKILKEWLQDNEEGFRKYEAYTHMIVGNNYGSKEAEEVTSKYGDWLIRRHSAQQRIKNLESLIGKYEAIDNDLATRDKPS